MDEALNIVSEWLLCASSQIGHHYFQLPIVSANADAEDVKYRERVYCYELYHRWRCHWPDDFPYTLNGEIDKAGHPVVPGKSKPDFLVHVPGQMKNLLIVEVKPANASLAEMVADLKKLTSFRRDLNGPSGDSANYKAAYFWVYGLGPTGWSNLRTRLLERIDSTPEFDHSLVSCVVHERAGERAVIVNLAD